MNKFLIYNVFFMLIILLNNFNYPIEINSVLPIVENNDTWIGGTIYIRADGRIEPPDAPIVTVDKVTYIVVKNINITRGDGIVIERNNIILDGNKHFIHGPGGLTTGIKIPRGGNIKIKNFVITNFYWGLYIIFTSNVTIVNNTITNNYGFNVLLGALSSNITVSYNVIENSNYGIYLSGSIGVSILNNIFINSGLFVSGSYGNIVLNNTVNGKPLIYFENISDTIITGEAGQVVINRGVNVTITGLNISYVPVGIHLIKTENSIILGNSLVNNYYSIFLERSNNITIANNIIDGGESGIYIPRFGVLISESDNTTISNNVIKNYLYGVFLYGSVNNSIINNIFTNCGLHLDRSYNNNVVDNTVNNKLLVYLENVFNVEITGAIGQVIVIRGINVTIRDLDVSNTTVGIYLIGVDNARIINNKISNNIIGIELSWLSNSLIMNNTVEYNLLSGIAIGASSNNMFIGNNIKCNDVGLSIGSSQDNVFLYNNFINNTVQIEVGFEAGSNTWDDGRIGNYWSDHECIDSDNNGVCENPYVIREPDNVDRYPSKNPFYEIPVQPPPPTETPPLTEPTPVTPPPTETTIEETVSPPIDTFPETTATETVTSALPTDSIPALTSPYEESTVVFRRGEDYILIYLILVVAIIIIILAIVIVMKKR